MQVQDSLQLRLKLSTKFKMNPLVHQVHCSELSVYVSYDHKSELKSVDKEETAGLVRRQIWITVTGLFMADQGSAFHNNHYHKKNLLLIIKLALNQLSIMGNNNEIN